MPERRGEIIVAAGVNGAGKSTIIGQYAKNNGAPYFNPDERTRDYVKAGFDEFEANARSWQEGFDALTRAIDNSTSYTFETTLGGKSIITELFRALARGRPVTIYFVGLNSIELHLRRVAARVKRGGHYIPEEKIRERYVTSRENVLGFIGTQASLRVWDNSEEDAGGRPRPVDVLIIEGKQILYPDTAKALKATPTWAKPLMQRALESCKIPAALRRATSRGK
ncbi:MAG: zeta toxin family protein [Pseudomonadota bacterium]|nr:zeta toxin family protein [Pseudomonadota bacterium]